MLLSFCKAIFACLPEKGCLRRANNVGELSAVFSCNYHLSLNNIHKKGDIFMWDLALLLDLLKTFTFNLWIDIKILKICLKDSTCLAHWIYWIKYTREYFDSYSYIERDKAGPFTPTTPLNNAQIENTEWLPLHQVIANCQFPQACLDAYWSSSWAAGAIYFQQIQQETSWLNELLETNGMGGEVEELMNSSNLINRLQPFLRETCSAASSSQSASRKFSWLPCQLSHLHFG